MQITTSPTREKFPLSTKKIWRKTISNVFTWTMILSSIYAYVFLLLAFISKLSKKSVLGADYFIPSLLAILAFLFIFFVLNYLYQRQYFTSYYYNFEDNFIVIKKGVFSKLEITLPYEKIQDVYVGQGVWDRIFGLYNIYFASAAISSIRAAHIDGLEKPAAEELRTLILKIIQEEKR